MIEYQNLPRVSTRRSYNQVMLGDTQSINHQYYAYKDRVKKVYAKTIVGMLGVRRLDPADHYNVIDALLRTNIDGVDMFSGEIPFIYTNDCVELYSDEEVNVFERLNRKIIDEGILIPWLSDVDYVYIGEKRVDPNTGTPWAADNFKLVERPKFFEHTLRISEVR